MKITIDIHHYFDHCTDQHHNYQYHHDHQVMILGLELPSLNWSQRLRLAGLASVSLLVSNLNILALKVTMGIPNMLITITIIY